MPRFDTHGPCRVLRSVVPSPFRSPLYYPSPASEFRTPAHASPPRSSFLTWIHRHGWSAVPLTSRFRNFLVLRSLTRAGVLLCTPAALLHWAGLHAVASAAYTGTAFAPYRPLGPRQPFRPRSVISASSVCPLMPYSPLLCGLVWQSWWFRHGFLLPVPTVPLASASPLLNSAAPAVGGRHLRCGDPVLTLLCLLLVSHPLLPGPSLDAASELHTPSFRYSALHCTVFLSSLLPAVAYTLLLLSPVAWWTWGSRPVYLFHGLLAHLILLQRRVLLLAHSRLRLMLHSHMPGSSFWSLAVPGAAPAAAVGGIHRHLLLLSPPMAPSRLAFFSHWLPLRRRSSRSDCCCWCYDLAPILGPCRIIWAVFTAPFVHAPVFTVVWHLDSLPCRLRSSLAARLQSAGRPFSARSGCPKSHSLLLLSQGLLFCYGAVRIGYTALLFACLLSLPTCCILALGSVFDGSWGLPCARLSFPPPFSLSGSSRWRALILFLFLGFTRSWTTSSAVLLTLQFSPLLRLFFGLCLAASTFSVMVSFPPERQAATVPPTLFSAVSPAKTISSLHL